MVNIKQNAILSSIKCTWFQNFHSIYITKAKLISKKTTSQVQLLFNLLLLECLKLAEPKVVWTCVDSIKLLVQNCKNLNALLWFRNYPKPHKEEGLHCKKKQTLQARATMFGNETQSKVSRLSLIVKAPYDLNSIFFSPSSIASAHFI